MGRSQGEPIPSFERATIDAAKAADDMCRTTSEDYRHVDTAVDRDIRPRPRSARAEPQDSAALHAVRSIDRCRLVVDRRLEIRAGYRHHRRLIESQFRTKQRCFQCPRVGRVSNQRVCKTMRLAIHWSGNGHTLILITPSTAVLDRREEPWTNDRHPAIRHLSPVAQAFMACVMRGRLSISANLEGSRHR